jgi:hypothetical protein
MPGVGGENPVFQGLLDAELPDDAELARVGSSWFDAAARGLAPALWDQLQRSLPLSPARAWDAPHGEPGGVWAYVSVAGRPWRGQADTRVYSAESFGWMLGQLAGRPVEAALHLLRLDESGVPDEAGGRQLMISVRTEWDHPQWVQLLAISALPGAEGDPRRPEVSDRWAPVLCSMAGQIDASFGHLTDDAWEPGSTALDEVVLRARPGRAESMMAGREVLRGYSWVTVCPRELAERLGGADGLAASGAFAEVEELPHGGMWLQATDHFVEYDDAAVRRVFEVLAPVLPKGMPKPDPFAVHSGRKYRLAWEDAAAYQSARSKEAPSERLPMPPKVTPLVVSGFDAVVGPGAGAVADASKGYELRFERHVSQDCNAVWQVLTDASSVLSWLGRIPSQLRQPEYVIEPFAGGRVRLAYLDSTEDGGPLSTPVFELEKVVEAEAPVLFESAAPGPDGPDTRKRWRLYPDPDGGCLVSFSYVFQRLSRIALLLADWHCRMDAIVLVLDGHAPDIAWERWRARYDAYRSLIRIET